MCSAARNHVHKITSRPKEGSRNNPVKHIDPPFKKRVKRVHVDALHYTVILCWRCRYMRLLSFICTWLKSFLTSLCLHLFLLLFVSAERQFLYDMKVPVSSGCLCLSVCLWTGQKTKCHDCNCRTCAVVPEARWYLNHVHHCAHIPTHKVITVWLQAHFHHTSTPTWTRTGWKGFCVIHEASHANTLAPSCSPQSFCHARPVKPAGIFYIYSGDSHTYTTFDAKTDATWVNADLVFVVSCSLMYI